MGYAVTNYTIKHLDEVEFGNHHERHLSFCESLNGQIAKTDTPRKIWYNGADGGLKAMSFIGIEQLKYSH